jgi:uncharacterized membrane protein YcaP (DUF421 family)
MVIAIRLFGKNQLSQLNAGDVVLLLLISNAVQNAMVGPDTSGRRYCCCFGFICSQLHFEEVNVL